MSFVIPRPATPSLPLLALVCGLLLAVGAIFFDSLQAMWSVWRSSESFAHGPLIPLGTVWLVWRRRALLAELPLLAFWPALIALAGSGFAWLLGRLAGVNALEQFAIVSMIPGLVALVFGWRVAWAIAFPLLFLFFAVPFGTFLLPTLMDWTADFTVLALQFSGIPVLREGTSFTLPSGRWSVVESCSGIRYLLAALPLAFLYAYLSYQSFRARTLFILLALATALVANWLRAYIIVMLGHISNMRIAVGADHLVYGWVFFGLVMALTFWLGGFIRDPAHVADARTGARTDAEGFRRTGEGTSASTGRLAVAASAGLALLIVWPHAADAIRSRGDASLDIARLAPLLDPPADAADDGRHYHPQYRGASQRVVGRSPVDPAVKAMVLRYIHQDRTGEMIHEVNRVMPGKPDDPIWQIRARRTAVPAALGSPFPRGTVNEYVVAGPDGLHLVWEWYEIQGETLNSPARVKLATALAILRGAGDESLAWFVWTPLIGPAETARLRLAAETARLGRIPLAYGR